MINVFQGQKEIGQEIAEKETELYGTEGSKSIDADGINQGKASGNARQASGARKEKKGEPKEYDIKTAYKHLFQLYLNTEESELEALRQASMIPNKGKDDDNEDFFEELVTEGESSRMALQAEKKQSN